MGETVKQNGYDSKRNEFILHFWREWTRKICHSVLSKCKKNKINMDMMTSGQYLITYDDDIGKYRFVREWARDDRWFKSRRK